MWTWKHSGHLVQREGIRLNELDFHEREIHQDQLSRSHRVRQSLENERLLIEANGHVFESSR
jgi:hypothetical protein